MRQLQDVGPPSSSRRETSALYSWSCSSLRWWTFLQKLPISNYPLESPISTPQRCSSRLVASYVEVYMTVQPAFQCHNVAKSFLRSQVQWQSLQQLALHLQPLAHIVHQLLRIGLADSSKALRPDVAKQNSAPRVGALRARSSCNSSTYAE